jgi:hypothetical protein
MLVLSSNLKHHLLGDGITDALGHSPRFDCASAPMRWIIKVSPRHDERTPTEDIWPFSLETIPKSFADPARLAARTHYISQFFAGFPVPQCQWFIDGLAPPAMLRFGQASL